MKRKFYYWISSIWGDRKFYHLSHKSSGYRYELNSAGGINPCGWSAFLRQGIMTGSIRPASRRRQEEMRCTIALAYCHISSLGILYIEWPPRSSKCDALFTKDSHKILTIMWEENIYCVILDFHSYVTPQTQLRGVVSWKSPRMFFYSYRFVP